MSIGQCYFFSKKHIFKKLFSLEVDCFPLEYAFSPHFSGDNIFLKYFIWKIVTIALENRISPNYVICYL